MLLQAVHVHKCVHSSCHMCWLGKAPRSWELLVPGGASWQLSASPLPPRPVPLDAETEPATAPGENSLEQDCNSMQDSGALKLLSSFLRSQQASWGAAGRTPHWGGRKESCRAEQSPGMGVGVELGKGGRATREREFSEGIQA